MVADDLPEAECPICGAIARTFGPGGHPDRRRPDCRCQGCGSLERHRGLWLHLRDRTAIVTDAIRMLHVAPDKPLAARFRLLPDLVYVTGDLDPSKGDIQLDLTAMALPDDAFDLILVSHVLEHIPDDLAAMRELRRVLSPRGVAIRAVPMWGDSTREDLTITDPAERRRLYGQPDHVRMYGRDGVFEARLQSAGFAVTVDRLERFDRQTKRRYRIRSSEPIIACT